MQTGASRRGLQGLSGGLTRATLLRQSDVEDMIWEVDDDCDKRVNWNEFQAMFMRCRNDKTGAWRAARAPGGMHRH